MQIKKEPEIALTLIPAPDDEPQSTEYQTEIQAFAQSLRANSVVFNSIRHMRESAWASSFNLGEFGIVAKTIGPLLTGLIGAWLHARYGRKVKLKFEDIEVEATTIEDVERLIELAHKPRKKHRKKFRRK